MRHASGRGQELGYGVVEAVVEIALGGLPERLVECDSDTLRLAPDYRTTPFGIFRGDYNELIRNSKHRRGFPQATTSQSRQPA
jgi:hypothetical protein